MTVGAWTRWKLLDPSGTLPDWTLPINPNQMVPQQPAAIIESAVGAHGHHDADRQTPTAAVQWTFQGTLFTLADLNTLETWLNLSAPVTLVDHWGFRYRVLITAVDTVRAGKRRSHGRHTYTVHALLLFQYPETP